MNETKSGAWAHRSTESMMGFARLDDCLDMMVPSDLREIVGRLAREEKEHAKTLVDRDRLHEWADKLAHAIGGEAIGEHSNLNNPWANALDVAEFNGALFAEMSAALEAIGAEIPKAAGDPLFNTPAERLVLDVLAKLALPLHEGSGS